MQQNAGRHSRRARGDSKQMSGHAADQGFRADGTVRAGGRSQHSQEPAQQPGSSRTHGGAQEPLDDWVPIDFEQGMGSFASHRTSPESTGDWQPIDGAGASHRMSGRRGGAFPSAEDASSQPTQAFRAVPSAARAPEGGMGGGSNQGAYAQVQASEPNGSGPASYDGAYAVKKKRRKRHTGRKVALAIVIVLAVALVGAGAAVALSAKDLSDQAHSALQDANDVQSALASSDYAQAAASARDLQSAAHTMNGTLQSPLWSAAASAPIVGSDVQNVRTLAKALSEVSDGAIEPLAASLSANGSSKLVGDDGSIDVDAMNRLLNAVEQGAPSMQQAADGLNAMPAMHIAQLQPTVDSAKQKIIDANNVFQQVSQQGPVINSLLGAGDGTYLVVAQNSAELRAAGGFPGSMGTLTIANGKLSLGDFAAVYDVIDSIPSNLTAEEKNLFYNYPDYTMNIGYNPDFPRVAKAWADSYQYKQKKSVDGVISITPSVVQDLLRATGASITLSDGTQLDGSNATKVLEHDVYWKYLSQQSSLAPQDGNDAADALFAEAAKKAFDTVLGNVNASSLSNVMGALSGNMRDRHIMMWFADENRQSQIASDPISGSLDASNQTQPTLGVFVGPWESHKLGWWLGCDTQVGSPDVAADGTRTYHVTTTLSNSLTDEEMATGGEYIVGTGMLQSKGDMDPFTYLYVPVGGSIQNLQSSNGAQYQQGTYKGVQVLYTPKTGGSAKVPSPTNPLLAGQSVTITYDVVLPASVQGDLQVETMPTLTAYH